jgi:hypothetical protein
MSGIRRPDAGRRVTTLLPPLQDPHIVASFVRGLTAGALIGAAIAGSAVLQRRRPKRGELEEADPLVEEQATDVP